MFTNLAIVSPPFAWSAGAMPASFHLETWAGNLIPSFWEGVICQNCYILGFDASLFLGGCYVLLNLRALLVQRLHLLQQRLRWHLQRAQLVPVGLQLRHRRSPGLRLDRHQLWVPVYLFQKFTYVRINLVSTMKRIERNILNTKCQFAINVGTIKSFTDL